MAKNGKSPKKAEKAEKEEKMKKEKVEKTEKVKAQPKEEKMPKVSAEEKKEAKLKAALLEAEAEKAKLDQELREIRLNRNKKLLQNIPCDNCGTLLEIPLEEVLVEGITARDVVCKNCQHVNRMTIQFEGSPYDVDPTIKQSDKGIEYMVVPITQLSSENVFQRVLREVEMADASRNKLDPRVHLLLKAVAELINKG
jgi:hypothetical protein